jgi:predicted secreted protein
MPHALRALSLSLVTLALALGGCSSSTDATAPATGDEEDITKQTGLSLTADDDGSIATITAGKKLVLKLSSNPTTGYDWVVTSTDKTLGYPTDSFASSSGATGSGGTKTFTWATKGLVGRHHVALSYKRSWEKTAAQTFSFDVDVRPSSDAKVVVLGEDDAGRTARVTAGQSLVVNLPANATTGYEWRVTSTDKTFGYPTSSYAVDGDAVGSGGVQTLTWKTTSLVAGEHDVVLGYMRASDKKASKTLTFTARVVN